jgi:glycosyltransferase involved in cell wall biosynthesis
MSEISVIIPSYNSAATIGRTLDALLSQSQKPREVIVVDSSDDGLTPGLLREYDRRIHLIRLEKKTIPAIGRNLGADAATGQTLAFIDSDAYPAHDWIEKIEGARAKGTRVGGGSVLVPEFQRKDKLALAQYFLQFNEFTDSGEVREKKFIPSVNLFCETALFREAGGFPRIRAAEDVLFGLNVGSISPVIFDPAMRVFHIFRTQPEQYFRNQQMLGRYIPLYRRTRSAFFRTNWLLVPSIPLVLAAKFFRIVGRVLQGRRENILPFLSSLPLFLEGLGYWAIGFFEGCQQKTELAPE